MYKSKRKARITGEVLLACLAIIILFGAGLFDYSIFSIDPDFVTADDKLFSTLFTVQATTTAISISILTLLTGSVNDQHVGISVTRYITSLRPVLFKHRLVVIINVLLTFLNYFLVSYDRNNLSVAVFSVCTLIIVYLVIDMYSVFRGREHIYQEIEDYYLNHYKKLGFKDLETAIFSTPDTVALKDYYQNIQLLKNIYLKKITIGDTDYKDLDSLLSRVLHCLFDAGDTERIEHFISLMCDIYQVANKRKEPIILKLWDELSWDYYQSLRIIDLSKRDNFDQVELLHALLYRNQKIEVREEEDQSVSYKPLNGFDLTSYSLQVYYAIQNKKDERTDYKTYLYLIRSLIVEIGYRLEDSGLIDYQRDLLIKELGLLYRYLIYYGEFDALKKFVFKYDHTLDTRRRLAVYIALIYIYYLKTESLTPQSVLDIIDTIVNQNRNDIHLQLMYSDSKIQSIIEYYDFFQDTMRLWEEWPEDGNGKLIVMDSTIQLFFVLTAIKNQWPQEDMNRLLRTIFSGNMYYAYTTYSYKKSRNIDNIYKKYLEVFQYNTTDEDRYEQLQLIDSSLAIMCKDEEIQQKQAYCITDETEREFTRLTIQHINDYTEENNFLFDCGSDKEYSNTRKIGVLYTNILAGDPSFPHFNEHLKNYIDSSIIKTLIKIARDHIKTSSIEEQSKTKQQTLIDLAKENGIDPNTMLGIRDVFWGEENEHLLLETYKDIHKVPYNGGYNNIYLLDSSKIHLRVTDVRVEYNNLDDSEIAERHKTDEDGNELYRANNGLYLPFSEKEYREYMNSTYKNAYIYAKFSWDIDEGIIGVGIEVRTKT